VPRLTIGWAVVGKVKIGWAAVGKVTIGRAVVGKVAVSIQIQHYSVKEKVGINCKGSDEQVAVAKQAENANCWPSSVSRSLLTATAIPTGAHAHVLQPISCGCAVTMTSSRAVLPRANRA
jgi:hypothetical protein